MNNKLLMVLGIGLSAALTGCQGDERIGEVSTKERQAQIDVENKLATEMENDLQTRQKFYQAVAGVYEGQAQANSGTVFNIRIRLVPSIAPFSAKRVRMREEVASDLNNLYYNAQVLLWTPESKVGAVGCRATGIRANLNEGTIEIASTDCPNFYTIKINDEGLINGKVQDTSVANSQRIARGIMDGKITKAASIYGEIQPTSSSDALNFTAERSKNPADRN
jgi:hypothetical protein